MIKLTLGILPVLVASHVWVACGRTESPSDPARTHIAQIHENGSAADLVVPKARWCGNDPECEKTLEETYQLFVDKLAQTCNAQNDRQRAAKRSACAVDECLESITLGTPADGRRLRVDVFNNSITGGVGLLVSWSADQNIWNRSLPSLGANCIHANIFAETHFGLRELLREKSFEARSSCGNTHPTP